MNAASTVPEQLLAAAKPSATYRIIDRVAARRASGDKIISLSAGEPDFDTPAHVRQPRIAAINAGHTRYTQVAGLRALREAVAAKFQRENGLDVTGETRIVCSGGKQVIFNALAATLNEGDEVIVPAPYWVSYPEMVQLSGARVGHRSLRKRKRIQTHPAGTGQPRSATHALADPQLAIEPYRGCLQPRGTAGSLAEVLLAPSPGAGAVR